MLKFQNWYAGIWLAVIVLYVQGWSTLNMPLEQSLLYFFIGTALFSIVMASFSVSTPVYKMRWNRKRKPAVTVALVVGFILDWMYRGELPITGSYQGFDASSAGQVVMGIPVVHVVIIGVTVFYAMYLQYLFLSDTKQKGYLLELLTLLLILLLNNSRGYVVFSLFIGVLLFAAFNKKTLFNTKISVMLLLVLGVLGIVFFISVVGNIRSGYSWNDCSYIERIGYYKNYPSWLSKHFMWFYTYATSPLGNLNLNCELAGKSVNLLGIFCSFLPEQLSNSYTLRYLKPVYIVQHLNACTGFVSFADAGGATGLFMAFVGMYIYYSVINFVVKKFKILQTFGSAMLCFLTVAFTFFNCFTTSALCYIPLFLIIASAFLKRRLDRGELSLIKEGGGRNDETEPLTAKPMETAADGVPAIS